MNKMMEAQYNIRNNTHEMQEYLKDLQTWESKVKKKDKDLQKGRPPGGDSGVPASKTTPAPRGRAKSVVGAAPSHLQAPAAQLQNPASVKAQKPKMSKKKKAPVDVTAAGHTYDYYKDKWDKFDVDAALADSDGEVSEEEGEEPQTTAADSDMPPIRQPLDAEGWRTKGNEWFKLGEYRQAKDCYSSSIDSSPTALAFANRAMAAIKLGELSLAEGDCTAAIELDPAYMKSWQRRGSTRKAQGKTREACGDFEMALRLQPSSTALLQEFQSCFATLQSDLKLLPLRKKRQVPVTVEMGPEPVAAEPDDATKSTAGAVEGQIKATAGPGRDSRAIIKEKVAQAASAAVQRVSQSTAHSVPKTSTEFETAWKSFKGQLPAQAEYLRMIDSSAMPVLFKSSLTGPLLREIAASLLASVAENPQEGAWAAALLEGLGKVPRFDMTAMLLGKPDKAVLAAGFDRCSACPAELSDRLRAIRQKLRV